MKKYIAIGYFKNVKEITSIACKSNTKKDFMDDCKANGFVALAAFTQDRIMEIIEMDRGSRWNEIKKIMGKNRYSSWDIVNEYIEQCGYIIEEKLEA